jgi:hypothetical protein
MHKLRNLVLIACLVLATTPTVLADPDVSFDGIAIGWNYTPYPPTKVAGVLLGEIQCLEGHTCGLLQITINWDDGTVEHFYTYAGQTPGWFYHEYADNGLRHGTVYVEDEDQNGNWWLVEDLDFHILS